MRPSPVPFALALLLVGPAAASAQEPAPLPDFAVVVHPANPTRELPADDVARMFLGDAPKWANGIDVQPVNQHSQERAVLREAFSRKVHGVGTETVLQKWQRYIFSGERVPPPEMRTDAEVLEFVRTNPGAIGYVSADADTAGVRVVRLRASEPAEEPEGDDG